jgi:hypothetical protein
MLTVNIRNTCCETSTSIRLYISTFGPFIVDLHDPSIQEEYKKLSLYMLTVNMLQSLFDMENHLVVLSELFVYSYLL